MDWRFDERITCWSVLTSMPIGEYIELVKEATAERGNLTGQRDVLKTTTAKRIRERMVSDIIKGAVLPPIVLGALIDDATFANSHFLMPNLGQIFYPSRLTSQS